MFGKKEMDKAILQYYEKMPLQQIAKKVKCNIHHVKYVLYKKKRRR